MSNQSGLRDGDDVRCPHCQQWHPVVASAQDVTPATKVMRYAICRAHRYYVGMIGNETRWPRRPGQDET